MAAVYTTCNKVMMFIMLQCNKDGRMAIITISNLWPGRTTHHGGGYASGTSAGCLYIV